MKPEKPSDPDEVKFENELLRLKLKLEHGMEMSDTSGLSAQTENQWLNNVYNFEQQFKSAKKATVYEVIGRPAFKKLEELSVKEVTVALRQLLSCMEEKGVALDCSCQYEDALIYKFITEELFNFEMDDISVEGMTHHFIYEEFHPNHDYDLRRHAKEFIENLLTRKWNPEFDVYTLNNTVSYKGIEYDHQGISAIILAFQKDRNFQLEKIEIGQVSFDVEKGEGNVQAYLAYHAYSPQGNKFHQGDSMLQFYL